MAFFTGRRICSLVYRVLSSVLHRTGFVVINSFGLFLSWKFLIFPLSVADSFAGYSRLGWQLLSSSIALNRAFQALLSFKDLVVESDVTCVSLLPLSTYYFCSLYLVFEVVNLGCEFCWASLWGFFFLIRAFEVGRPTLNLTIPSRGSPHPVIEKRALAICLLAVPLARLSILYSIQCPQDSNED